MGRLIAIACLLWSGCSDLACAEAQARGRRARRGTVSTRAPSEWAVALPNACKLVVLDRGQSLCNGGQSTGALSTVQQASNQRHYAGTTRALIEEYDGEGVRIPPSASPAVESPKSARLAQMASLSGGSGFVVLSRCTSSAPYSQIEYGGTGTEFANLESDLTDYVSDVSPQCVRVVASLLNHGENDENSSNLTYDADLAQEYSDIQTRMKAITGQTEPIPVVLGQMNSSTAYAKAHNLIGDAQLWAYKSNIEELWLYGPKSYNKLGADSRHLTAASSRQLGEEEGEFLHRLLFADTRPGPIYPTSAAISGDELVITFAGCRGSLTLDTTTIEQTGLPDHGFRVYESEGVSISTVTAGPGCAVTLTGSADWPSTTQVSYAYEGTSGASHGADQTGSMRGSLRDSHAFTGALSTDTLYQWAVAFGPGHLTPTGGVAPTKLTNTMAIDLDAAGDFIARADGTDVECASTAMTLFADIYPQAFPHQWGIASKSANSQSSYGWYMGTNGRLFFTAATAGNPSQDTTNYVATAVGTISAGAWRRVVVTRSGATITHYVEGAVAATAATAGTMPSGAYNDTTASWAIGRYQDGNDGVCSTAANCRYASGLIKNAGFVCGEAWDSDQVAAYGDFAGAASPIGIGTDSNIRVFARLGDGYSLPSGRVTGTPEGISGTTTFSTSVKNSAPDYSANALVLNGDPTAVAVP